MSSTSLLTFTRQLRAVRQDALKPPPSLSLSEWSDTYRFLSSEYSAAPGRWRTNRAPYQKEMLDVAADPNYEQVILMISSQLGKTELAMNLVFYYVAQDPAPMLLVMPTKEDCAAFSKTKLAPAIRDTKVVSRLFSETKSNTTADTILSKNFTGGSVSMVGSNSPSGLASKSVRVLICDEVDRFAFSAADEGDPFSLAKQRTANFFNRKIVAISTPTEEATSRIWPLYKNSDQRKFFIQCIHCDEYFEPKWEHVRWQKAEDDPHKHLPETAQIHCPHCSAGHNNHERLQAAARGKWIKHNPDSKVAGFHTSALVSPWATLEGLVEEWLVKCKDPILLKTFYNTKLGLPFEDRSQNIDDLDLMSRVEAYDVTSLPEGIALLTAGVDVQGDRIEASVWGWGKEDESWLVEHQVFFGDTTSPETWRALELFLKTRYLRSDGLHLGVSAACIDSGYNAQVVWNFTQHHKTRSWFSIKGFSGNRPIFPPRASYSYTDKKFYAIGVDTAKDLIYARLKYTQVGPGYVHFPDSCTMDYFAQLAAERKVLKNTGGVTHWVWKKKRQDMPNECLDTFCYALAARTGLNTNITALLRRQRDKLEKQKAAGATTPTPDLERPTKIINLPEDEEIPANTLISPTLNKVVAEPPQKIPAWKKNLGKKSPWSIR